MGGPLLLVLLSQALRPDAGVLTFPSVQRLSVQPTSDPSLTNLGNQYVVAWTDARAERFALTEGRSRLFLARVRFDGGQPDDAGVEAWPETRRFAQPRYASAMGASALAFREAGANLSTLWVMQVAGAAQTAFSGMPLVLDTGVLPGRTLLVAQDPSSFASAWSLDGGVGVALVDGPFNVTGIRGTRQARDLDLRWSGVDTVGVAGIDADQTWVGVAVRGGTFTTSSPAWPDGGTAIRFGANTGSDTLVRLAASARLERGQQAGTWVTTLSREATPPQLHVSVGPQRTVVVFDSNAAMPSKTLLVLGQDGGVVQESAVGSRPVFDLASTSTRAVLLIPPLRLAEFDLLTGNPMGETSIGWMPQPQRFPTVVFSKATNQFLVGWETLTSPGMAAFSSVGVAENGTLSSAPVTQIRPGVRLGGPGVRWVDLLDGGLLALGGLADGGGALYSVTSQQPVSFAGPTPTPSPGLVGAVAGVSRFIAWGPTASAVGVWSDEMSSPLLLETGEAPACVARTSSAFFVAVTNRQAAQLKVFRIMDQRGVVPVLAFTSGWSAARSVPCFLADPRTNQLVLAWRDGAFVFSQPVLDLGGAVRFDGFADARGLPGDEAPVGAFVGGQLVLAAASPMGVRLWLVGTSDVFMASGAWPTWAPAVAANDTTMAVAWEEHTSPTDSRHIAARVVEVVPRGAGVDGGAGLDAGLDGGPVVDAGLDAGVDGGPVVDAGPDAGVDGGPVVDARLDAGADGGPVDAGVDAGELLDGGLDAGDILFVANGCGCSSPGPTVSWFMLLALAARRRSRGR